MLAVSADPDQEQSDQGLHCLPLSELQISGGIEDNSKIIFLISQ